MSRGFMNQDSTSDGASCHSKLQEGQLKPALVFTSQCDPHGRVRPPGGFWGDALVIHDAKTRVLREDSGF